MAQPFWRYRVKKMEISKLGIVTAATLGMYTGRQPSEAWRPVVGLVRQRLWRWSGRAGWIHWPVVFFAA